MRLYTDIDPFCCEVLKARVADGGLLPGEVWQRDIKTLTAAELKPFKQVHLFAGIGASPLGFKWAGWPDDWSLVTGGFPCQDISSAGKGAGLDGARSGLFWELLRVADIKRPDWVFVENVGALSSRGLDRVVGAVGSLGYGVTALRMGAWVVGSPQKRERWWIVAHTSGYGRKASIRHPVHEHQDSTAQNHSSISRCQSKQLANSNCIRVRQPQASGRQRSPTVALGPGEGGAVADVRSSGLRTERIVEARTQPDQPDQTGRPSCGVAQGDAAGEGLEGHGHHSGQPQEPESRYANPRRWPHPLWVDADGNPVATPQYEWEQPRLYTRGMAGLADGIPGRLASALNKCGVSATGNAQVPQCVEVIARAMINSFKGRTP